MTVKPSWTALAPSVAAASPPAFAVSELRSWSRNDTRGAAAAFSSTARFARAVVSHVKPRARASAAAPSSSRRTGSAISARTFAVSSSGVSASSPV